MAGARGSSSPGRAPGDYDGDRTFRDEMASCGEFSDRTCGVNGTTCRQRQDSVALLKQRLGTRRDGSSSNGSANDRNDAAGSGMISGCTAGSGGTGAAMALALFGVVVRRRRRR